MHTLKALVLTASLVGITATAALAHDTPRTCAPAAPAHRQAVCKGHTPARQTLRVGQPLVFRKGQMNPRCAETKVRSHSRQAGKKAHWQGMAPAKRQALHAKRQQWQQRGQQLTPAEREAAKLRWQQRGHRR